MIDKIAPFDILRIKHDFGTLYLRLVRITSREAVIGIEALSIVKIKEKCERHLCEVMASVGVS